MKQQYQSPSLVAGANLKRLMKKKGMTQMQVADLLGYSDDRCIRRLVHDGIQKTDVVWKIVNCLGVSFDEMFQPLD